MIRIGSSVFKGKNFLTAVAWATLFLALVAGCGEGRFDIGDKVGVPPIPPSDTIIGMFDKVPSSDLSGDVYRMKDVPENGVEQPISMYYGGRFRLFFFSGIAGDDVLEIAPGTSGLTTTDVIVGPGPNGKLESTPSGDDKLSLAICPGNNGTRQTAVVPDDDVSGEYILPGPDGEFDSSITGDDVLDYVVIDGGNGLAESPFSVKMGTVRAASPYIDTGPNGVAETGLAFDDVQVTAIGVAVKATDEDVISVGPGPNLTIESTPGGDDYLMGNVIVPGPNGARETTPGGDDMLSLDGNYVLPGLNDVLESTIIGDDSVGEVINAGPNYIAESGLGEGDIQGETVLKGGYYSFNGIPAGQGEPNRKAVGSGGNGKVRTPCIFDDSTELVNLPFTEIANSTYDPSYMRSGLNNGIYSGPDGIVQSGIGGDDVQVVYAGNAVAPEAILVKAGPDGILDTLYNGGDEIIVPNGDYVGSRTDAVIGAGEDGVLRTCPAGDDVVLQPMILAGVNLRVDTVASGDDIQLAPYLSLYRPDGSELDFDTPVIAAGPNGKIDSVLGGDDEFFQNPSGGGDLTERVIVAGSNKRADSVAGDDTLAIIDGKDNIVQSGLVGDDEQIVSAGLYSSNFVIPIVAAGPNGIIDTAVQGDDTYMVYDLNWPPGPANTTASGDDVQVVPVGQSTVQNIPGFGDVIFPIILPGPNGVIDSTIDPSDSLVIGEYGKDFDTFRAAAAVYGPNPALTAYPDPHANGILESGLGGRGAYDFFLNCMSTLDNGGTPGTDDPWTGRPAYDVCMARLPGCPDDCQKYMGGTAVPSNEIIIHPGPNMLLDTYRVPDDEEAIIDGGNGLAESGLSKGDEQIVKVGKGASRAVAITASRDRLTGKRRELTTVPAGDDRLVNPGNGDLDGDRDIVPDDKNTEVDPDDNLLVENFANVDDGEYFSWEETNLGPILVPLATANIPYDMQIINEEDPSAPLRLTNSLLTYDIMPSPVDKDRLVAYVSNGQNIYRVTSLNGTDWTSPELVIEAGGGQTASAGAPVVMAGVDGICDTTAGGDDVQNIPVGQGIPNAISVFAGADGVLQTPVSGDDRKDGMFIRTGADGIADSPVVGDDWTVIPVGEGQADSACILAGKDGRRSTADASLVNDDRPPFMDMNADSATNWLPDVGEPEIAENSWAGWDSFAVTHPRIFYHDGTYYMFYTGWGVRIEDEPKRPNSQATKVLGPCLRPGMDRRIDHVALFAAVNDDNNPSVVVAPRIGLAVSNNGKDWEKKQDPVVGIGKHCSDLFDLSITSALGLDLNELGVSPLMAASMDFDYLGSFGAQVRADNGADDEPVYSMVYSGIHFSRPYSAALGGLSGLISMVPSPTTGWEQYAGMKTGVGIARSFNLATGWEKLKDANPVFSSGIFYESMGDRSPAVTEVDDGYKSFFIQHTLADTTTPLDDTTFIGLALRYGTVYSMCMTAKSVAGTDAGRAMIGLLLILLPAAILVMRRTWLKFRK